MGPSALDDSYARWMLRVRIGCTFLLKTAWAIGPIGLIGLRRAATDSVRTYGSYALPPYQSSFHEQSLAHDCHRA